MGIGRAIAVRLAADGANLVIADCESAAEAAEDIRALGRRVLTVRCDISSPAEIADLRKQVIDEFARCDILVNNAGVFATRAFEEITFEDWKRMFAVNLDGMFLTVKALTRRNAQQPVGPRDQRRVQHARLGCSLPCRLYRQQRRRYRADARAG